MKVKELIDILKKLDPEIEATVFEMDNFYGDGYQSITEVELSEAYKNESDGIRIYDFCDIKKKGYSPEKVKIIRFLY